MTTIPERIREDVARAIYEAHPWGDEDAGTDKWELLGLEWQDVYLKMADAALDAASPLFLAAEKRGREEAAKIADKHAAENWGHTEEESAAIAIAAAIRSTN